MISPFGGEKKTKEQTTNVQTQKVSGEPRREGGAVCKKKWCWFVRVSGRRWGILFGYGGCNMGGFEMMVIQNELESEEGMVLWLFGFFNVLR